MLRNALAHGIESPDERREAGKPEEGTVAIDVSRDATEVVIRVSDDGRGMDRDAIRARAVDRGLLADDADPDDEELFGYVLQSGFSTAGEVTQLAGRGVGMDVVKRNIGALGGHVNLRSTPGAGTTIGIVLPLTLAIMEGMAVKVGAEVFIMPLSAIIESMQIRADQVRPVAGCARVIHVRGEYLPLVELHAVFDVANAQTDLTRGIVMVVQSENQRFALFFDALIGQQQVVVKNLETHFRKVPGVSAATILGDGSVALILDVIALSRSSRPDLAHAVAGPDHTRQQQEAV
jgi:two-component system chemotaxis sensor kinase CheA